MGTKNVLHMNGTGIAAVETAVARLVSWHPLNGRYRVSMPVALCTGTLVDVSVWPEPDGSFMVTDDGIAHFEVVSGAFSERLFRSVAKTRCGSAGAVFDGGTMLFLRVSADQLRGAIIAMANLIKEVVDETIARSIKQKFEGARDALFERLDMAFSPASVSHCASVIGASTAEYEVDALVETRRGLVVFDLFTKDPASIASSFTKLSDLARGDGTPRLVAVTPKPEDIGPKLTLIASVATVIRADSTVDVFRRAAA